MFRPDGLTALRLLAVTSPPSAKTHFAAFTSRSCQFCMDRYNQCLTDSKPRHNNLTAFTTNLNPNPNIRLDTTDHGRVPLSGEKKIVPYPEWARYGAPLAPSLHHTLNSKPAQLGLHSAVLH